MGSQLGRKTTLLIQIFGNEINARGHFRGGAMLCAVSHSFSAVLLCENRASTNTDLAAAEST